MKTNIYKLTTTLSLALLLSFSSPLSANIADSFGYGAAGIGMSGGRAALADDWTAAYFNIAGIAAPKFTGWPSSKSLSQSVNSLGVRRIKIKGKDEKGGSAQSISSHKVDPLDQKTLETESQFGMAIGYQHPIMNLAVKSDDAEVKEKSALAKEKLNYSIINLGFVFDMRTLIETPYDVPVKLGGSFAVPGTGSLANVSDGSVKDHSFQRLGSKAEHVVVLMGIAGQVWKDRLSIGFGVNVLAGGKGQMALNDVVIPATEDAEPPEYDVKMNVKPKPSPVAGLMFRMPVKQKHAISIGLFYRGETEMSIDEIEGSAKTAILKVKFPVSLAIADFYTPHIFGGGFAFSYLRKYTVSLDGEYQMWSGFHLSPARSRISTQEFEEFNDVVSGKLGLELLLRTPFDFLPNPWVRVRGGYSYVTAFTPDQTGASNYLDNEKHIGSIGLSYMLPRSFPMRLATLIDWGLQMQYWQPRSTQKAVVDAKNPDYSYDGIVYVTSLSFSWKF